MSDLRRPRSPSGQLRLAALEQRIDAELATGRHAELVGELEALISEHPLRERLRCQLMVALYRSGRQAEALETYQAARRALVEELGIEPARQPREPSRRSSPPATRTPTSPRWAGRPRCRRGVFVGRKARAGRACGRPRRRSLAAGAFSCSWASPASERAGSPRRPMARAMSLRTAGVVLPLLGGGGPRLLALESSRFGPTSGMATLRSGARSSERVPRISPGSSSNRVGTFPIGRAAILEDEALSPVRRSRRVSAERAAEPTDRAGPGRPSPPPTRHRLLLRFLARELPVCVCVCG